MRWSVWFGMTLLCACSQGGGGASLEEGACIQFGVEVASDVPASCGVEIAGEGDTVRVFAVAEVIRYAEMEDYASFCSAWDEVVRTEVLPCLATDKPNLLVFPENATLAAAFVGSGGAEGRAESESLPAFLSLVQTYSEPFAFYGERFPDASFNARLVLSLTDTLRRAFRTFSAIAAQYGVYVAVSSDFAPTELSDDPEDVAALADPDLEDVGSVYVATEPAGYNWGVFYGPDGQEIARVAKSYLVPAEEGLLDLQHGALAQARPVSLPFAEAAMVISKDAWMPGLLERLEMLGANLTLQPEAFSGWAVEEFEGDWLPDIVRQSSWGHTQRHGGFRHNVTPCIKGNLLDLVFDCQSHITKTSSVEDTERAFIGQKPYLGLMTVEPWVIDDPGPPASLEERRAILRERGERMLPGSGDRLEDSYRAETIAADLDLPIDQRVPSTGDGPPGAIGASAVIATPLEPRIHQRFPALAVGDGQALVAWMEGTPGAEHIRAFVETSEGALAPWELEVGEGSVQRHPRVAVGAERRVVVWEDESTDGRSAVRLALRVGSETQVTSIDTDEEAWAPDVAIDPMTGRFYVAWLDLRTGGRPKPWVAWSDDGLEWRSTQVDPSNSIDDNPRGDAAFVRVAAREGRAFVSFADFREFSWDVYLSTSEDGGVSFGDAQRINPEAELVLPVGGSERVESERLHGDVALGVDLTGNPVVAWTERQDRRYESRVRLWRAGVSRRIDDAPDGSDAWRPSIVVAPSAEIIVAWQDLRSGTNQIRLGSALGPDLAVSPSIRIDDAATGAHVYKPAIAVRGSETWVAWEDRRSGYARVRLARGVR